MIDWTQSYTVTNRLYRIDERTWTEADYIGGVRSCHIESSQGGLIESASLELDMAAPAEFRRGYYTLFADVEQGGAPERHALGTYYCVSDSGTVDKGFDVLKADGRSVLFPASVARLERGFSAPPGCDGADFAASMLASVLKAPVACSGSFALDNGYVFGIGQPVLDGVWTVLAAGGWCIGIDGRGRVEVMPLPSEPSLVLDGSESLLMPSVEHRSDMSSAYNTYTAIDGLQVARAVNDDPRSETSIAAVGYRNDAPYDTAPQRVNGETLEMYAERKLSEASTIRETWTYLREYQPSVRPYSAVSASMPEIGMVGMMRVKQQSTDISRGKRITVQESAVKEVRTWPV